MYKSLLWFTVLQGVLCVSDAGAPCERVANYSISWGSLVVLNVKTCFLDTVIIESLGFTLTSQTDTTTAGLRSYGNQKIKFLPENVGETFPNLVFWHASYCLIKTISRENFKNLSKLRGLGLQGNQIEKISSDTFDDLIALEILWLNRNKITHLNGQVFNKLIKLKEVWLSRNECINEDFKTPSQLLEMPRVVSEKCEYAETSVDPASSKLSDSDNSVTVDARSKLEEQLSKENEKLKLDLDHANAEILALTSTKDELKEVYEKLAAKLEEICSAKMESKLVEISHLNNEIIQKSFDAKENEQKLKQCQKKLDILGNENQW